MRVLGMISGTSHDGIDVAVVDFTARDRGDEPHNAPGEPGSEPGWPSSPSVQARIEYTACIDYPDWLRALLIRALPPAATDVETVCRLDTAIGQAFAAAAQRALVAHSELGFDPVELICSHGQTVFHWVEAGRARGTLQLGQPAWIAEATGLPVVSDVRAADLAAGGQGAPLVPVLDRLLLRPFVAAGRVAAALNLGGIANITVCAPGLAPTAWDIGPANALIDAVATASSTTPDSFDRDGALAAAGTVDTGLLRSLLAEPYFSLVPPKSTGKELFHLRYLDTVTALLGRVPTLPDLVATVTELTARTVAEAVGRSGVQTLLVSGGGVHNSVLLHRLGTLLAGVEIRRSDAVGVPADDKEAVAFALIGWAGAHGLPANVPSCTGAREERVLGSLTPPPRWRNRPIWASVAERPALHDWPTIEFVTADPNTGR